MKCNMIGGEMKCCIVYESEMWCGNTKPAGLNRTAVGGISLTKPFYILT